MIVATAAKLITVAEFLDRPEPAGGYEELRQGEIVMAAWAKEGHATLQHRIMMVLIRILGESAVVRTEMAFRAHPEFEIRRADVGALSAGRWEETDMDGYIMAAPEIVIEVESPSNTAREFREKEDLCLANGAIAFWVVYPELRKITVAFSEGSRIYRDGDEIELRGFGDKRVAVTKLLGPRRR